MNNLSKWVSLLLLLVCIAACVPTPAPLIPTPSQPATITPQDASVTASPSTTPSQTITPAAVSGQGSKWWNDTVFYEIFVRSFKDSDEDGIGDFNGITEMLDYLNDGDPTTTTDLGVTGIWLMPITQSPSYHGYDVVDYYQPDTEYGTRDDFLRMVAEAHKRGIRVIIDLVLNHTGLDHPWFKASDAGDPQYRDWYIWQTKNPGFAGPWGQQVWYAGKNGFYYAVFWSGMPDLNLQNPEVTQEIYKISEFWLNDMNVDGFRLDAIRHYVENGSVQENTQATHSWLQGYYQFYKAIDPEIFTVGEAWTDTVEVIDYVGDEVDIAFEFDLAESFVRAATGPIASSASKQLSSAVQSFPKGQYGVFLTNHDQNRVMSVLDGNYQKAKLAAVMLLTSPGVPFIYYGEEIGMTGTKPDEDIRLPMQWTDVDLGVGFTGSAPWRPAARNDPSANVAAQFEDPASLLSLYRSLIHLRSNHSALRTGDTLIIETKSQRLYAILRYDDTEAFLILVNVHPKPLTTELYNLSLETGPLKTGVKVSTILGLADPSAPVINTSGGFDSYQPFVEIPAETAIILKLAP